MFLLLRRGIQAPEAFGDGIGITQAPIPPPEFTVVINAGEALPLADRTRFVLEQTRGSADIMLRDLDSSIVAAPFDSVEIDDGTDVVWSGRVLRVRQIQGVHRPGKKDIQLTCIDNSWRFGHPPALISAAYQNATDQAIVLDLFAKAELDLEFTVDAANVDETATGLSVTFGPRWTLQKCLEHLSDLTGARGYLDPDGVFHWNLDGDAEEAPWHVDTDNPNGVTSHDVMELEVEDAFDEPGNDIIVVGGENLDALPVTASVNAPASISAYGRFRVAFEDSGWLQQSTVNQIAASALDSYKDPTFEFSFLTREHGLRPNQIIKLTCANYGLSEREAVIRRVEFYEQARHRQLYTVQGGNRPRSVEALMRRLRAARTSAQSTMNLLGCDFIAGGDVANAGDASEFRLLSFMTISLWIYARSEPSSDAILCAKGDGDTSGFSLEWRTDGSLNFHQATFFTTNHVRTTAHAIPLNQWTSVVVKSFWTTQVGEMYINGVEPTYASRVAPAAAADPDDGSPIIFGQNVDGVMALLAVYERGLFIEEMQSLAAKPEASRATAIPDLIGLWVMDDAADNVIASTLADSSGNGNNATTTGNPRGRLIPFVPL